MELTLKEHIAPEWTYRRKVSANVHKRIPNSRFPFLFFRLLFVGVFHYMSEQQQQKKKTKFAMFNIRAKSKKIPLGNLFSFFFYYVSMFRFFFIAIIYLCLLAPLRQKPKYIEMIFRLPFFLSRIVVSH